MLCNLTPSESGSNLISKRVKGPNPTVVPFIFSSPAAARQASNILMEWLLARGPVRACKTLNRSSSVRTQRLGLRTGGKNTGSSTWFRRQRLSVVKIEYPPGRRTRAHSVIAVFNECRNGATPIPITRRNAPSGKASA